MPSYISKFFYEPLNPYLVLEKAKSQIKNNSNLNENDFRNLEGYLNSIFYPTKKSSQQSLNRLQDTVIRSLGEQFQDSFESYDFSTNIGASKESQSEKIGVGLYERGYSHKKYINSDVLFQRLNLLQNKISEIQNEKEATETYQLMKQLSNDINNFLLQAGASIDNNIRINIENNNEFKVLLDKIDADWDKITFFDSLPFPNWKAGEVFEKALQTTQKGIDYIVNASEEELLEEFNKQTSGSESVGRGKLSLSTKVSGIKIEKNNDVYKITDSIEGKNGSIFTIKDVFEKKQGKMDISYTMPNINSSKNKKFKISAKNWAIVDSSRDFGNTSMLAALLRTTEKIDIAFKYAVQLNCYESPSLQWASKNYGKICAVVDIMMGYSQKNNYADTIVINNRHKKRIEVYSMYSILKKVEKNMNNNQYFVELTEYNKNSINLHQRLKPQLNYILTALKEYKISISANILKLDNK